MRKIDTIIIHCSDSLWGDAKAIEAWHRDKGWSHIGYHYVIDSAYPTYENLMLKKPDITRDGKLEIGIPLEVKGIHAHGYNATSIGICMIGREIFSARELLSLYKLVHDIEKQFGRLKIYGHYELNPYKTCPNIDADWLREFLHGNH